MFHSDEIYQYESNQNRLKSQRYGGNQNPRSTFCMGVEGDPTVRIFAKEERGQVSSWLMCEPHDIGRHRSVS